MGKGPLPTTDTLTPSPPARRGTEGDSARGIASAHCGAAAAGGGAASAARAAGGAGSASNGIGDGAAVGEGALGSARSGCRPPDGGGSHFSRRACPASLAAARLVLCERVFRALGGAAEHGDGALELGVTQPCLRG